MYVDGQLEFSKNQNIASDIYSENKIDLNGNKAIYNAIVDAGSGQPVYLVVQTTRTVTSDNPEAIVWFGLESFPTEDIAPGGLLHASSPQFKASTLEAGTVAYVLALPPDSYQRYLHVTYSRNEVLTDGAFTAFLTLDAQTWRAYAKNYVS